MLADAKPPASAAAPVAATRVTLIVARARNGVIGRHNTLPWHLPEDLAHFRRMTMGCAIVMGRRTWESIGRPLPGRTMIVVTSTAAHIALPAGVLAAADLDSALQLALAQTPAASQAPATSQQAATSREPASSPSATRDVFVIGGARLFRDAMPLATRIVLTDIDAEPDGDVHFPPFDHTQWQCVSRETYRSSTGLAYDISDLRRTPAAAQSLDGTAV